MLLGELLHGMKDSMYRKTTDWTGKTKDEEYKGWTITKEKSDEYYAERQKPYKNGYLANKTKGISPEDLKRAIDNIEKQHTDDDSTHDSPNYYDMIVELSRSDNNIKGNRELAQRQSQRAIEANGQKFDPGEFNKAFEEFKGAKISKAAFYKGPKDSKTKDDDHNKCEECGKKYSEEEMNGGGGRETVKAFGGKMLDVCKKCAEKIKSETKDEIHNCTRCETQLTYQKEDDKNTYMKCGECGKEYVFPKKDEIKDAIIPGTPEAELYNLEWQISNLMDPSSYRPLTEKEKKIVEELVIKKNKLKEEIKNKTKDTRGNVNHMGERQFDTYEGWKRACRQINPNVKIEGDKEVAQAGDVGEWDGVHGIIYGD